MEPEPRSPETTLLVEQSLRELQAGDLAARDRLIGDSQNRLLRLIQTMFRDHPALNRWEEVEDVYQRSVLRLWQVLQKCHPASAVEYYRLAAHVFRRELIDIARHHFGPQGTARNHATPHWDSPSENREPQPADTTWNAASLQPWTDFHEAVDALDDELRAVFDLLWYQGLPQADAARMLEISERTLRRRWNDARLALYDRLNPPDSSNRS